MVKVRRNQKAGQNQANTPKAKNDTTYVDTGSFADSPEKDSFEASLGALIAEADEVPPQDQDDEGQNAVKNVDLHSSESIKFQFALLVDDDTMTLASSDSDHETFVET